jgi:hypothetical protein
VKNSIDNVSISIATTNGEHSFPANKEVLPFETVPAVYDDARVPLSM